MGEIEGAVVSVGAGAEIQRPVRMRGRAALGFAAHVSGDTEIEDSIVMPEAWIGPGCTLRRAIVAQGVELPAGFVVDDALVCNDPGHVRELPPSTIRNGNLLVYSFVSQATLV